MKKTLLSITFLSLITPLFAQVTIADSIALGSPSVGYSIKNQLVDSIALGAASGGISYPNDVFYSMKNGVVATVPGNNWHIAFAFRKATSQQTAMRGATILVNEGRGVSLFASPQTTDNWNTFDTLGYRNWANPHNSDTTWDEGAFNGNRTSNPLDFGWGMYDTVSHNLIGTKIFLIRVTVLGVNTFKKITINSLKGDSQWVFTSANLDNTDSLHITLYKNGEGKKLFAYHNLITNITTNREPNAPWDFVFTRYGTFVTQFSQTIFSATTGVLSYPTIQVSKVTGVPFDAALPGMYTYNMNAIGTDWKINPGPGQPSFIVKDSITFFVKGADNNDDKLAFIAFRGASSGIISFKKETAKLIPGFSYPNDVFYNMKTGTTLTTDGTNWHLAFAIRNALPPSNVMRSTTILANEGRGVSVFQSTQSTDNFESFDTTGYRNWVMPHNSDSTIEIGALNANRTDYPFDYGWGEYDMTSHDILGTKIFLIRMTAGNGPNAVTIFKKVMISKLVYDSQWVFTYANLNNTETRNITINKSAFTNKLFAYHNLLTDITHDREPAAKWDLLFTRYGAFATQFGQTIFTANTGVLSYPEVKTSIVSGVPVNNANAGIYTDKYVGVGTDWKTNPGPGQPNFTIKDSLSYFIQGIDNREDKLVFTNFRGASNGVIVFNKTNIKAATGFDEKHSSNLMNIYPNPAISNLVIELSKATPATVSILDISGKVLLTENIAETQNTINISQLSQGLYFVCVEQNNVKKVARLVVQ